MFPFTREELLKIAAENFHAKLASDDASLKLEIAAIASCNVAGHAVMNASMLLNGGGAVALLAFIGHLSSMPQTAHVARELAFPLAYFVVGALVAALAEGATYISQNFNAGRWGQLRVQRYARESLEAHLGDKDQSERMEIEQKERDAKSKAKGYRRWARFFNSWAVVFTAAALLLFAAGCLNGYQAFVREPTQTATNSAPIGCP